jgi:hypothetical protein
VIENSPMPSDVVEMTLLSSAASILSPNRASPTSYLAAGATNTLRDKVSPGLSNTVSFGENAIVWAELDALPPVAASAPFGNPLVEVPGDEDPQAMKMLPRSTPVPLANKPTKSRRIVTFCQTSELRNSPTLLV